MRRGDEVPIKLRRISTLLVDKATRVLLQRFFSRHHPEFAVKTLQDEQIIRQDFYNIEWKFDSLRFCLLSTAQTYGKYLREASKIRRREGGGEQKNSCYLDDNSKPDIREFLWRKVSLQN